MSLQERTLVVKNFDPDRTTATLLKELCLQAGPVKNVVIKPDHAFVEFEDVDSVGYCKALLEGVVMFGQKLIMEPKLKAPTYFRYTKLLSDYINYDKQKQQQAYNYHRTMIQQECQRDPFQNQYSGPSFQAPPPQQQPQPQHPQPPPQQHLHPQPQPQQHPHPPPPAPIQNFAQNNSVTYVPYGNPQIFDQNAFSQAQTNGYIMNQGQWQFHNQVPGQQTYQPQPQLYQDPSIPVFNNTANYNHPPPFNQFRPYIPRDLANRPWADKDRWNRRR